MDLFADLPPVGSAPGDAPPPAVVAAAPAATSAAGRATPAAANLPKSAAAADLAPQQQPAAAAAAALMFAPVRALRAKNQPVRPAAASSAARAGATAVPTVDYAFASVKKRVNVDEYDPRRPNEYDKIIADERREKQRAEQEAAAAAREKAQQEKRARERKKEQERLQRQREIQKQSPAPVALSRVVLLSNMVTPDDVDDALQQETADECAKFGAVTRCVVHAAKAGVRIFVAFGDVAGARAACAGLNGRFFGGRVVSASQYSEDAFARGDYAQ